MTKLKITPVEIKKQFALLAETPRRIAACTAGLSAEQQLGRAAERRVWSAVEILAHLRGCEELWSFSIYAMLTQHNPVLPELEPRRWAKTMGYDKLEFAASFEVFAQRRAALLSVLADLQEVSWSRTATIKGRTHSVFSQVQRMAKHELEHCGQLEEMLQPR